VASHIADTRGGAERATSALDSMLEHLRASDAAIDARVAEIQHTLSDVQFALSKSFGIHFPGARLRECVLLSCVTDVALGGIKALAARNTANIDVSVSSTATTATMSASAPPALLPASSGAPAVDALPQRAPPAARAADFYAL
jgi:hypothetical protein